jgi:hypothetical protein
MEEEKEIKKPRGSQKIKKSDPVLSKKTVFNIKNVENIDENDSITAISCSETDIVSRLIIFIRLKTIGTNQGCLIRVNLKDSSKQIKKI